MVEGVGQEIALILELSDSKPNNPKGDDIMNTHDKIVKARTALILDAPFFGSMALRLVLKEDEMLERPESKRTCWVDGVSFGYNPDYIEQLSFDELKGVLCHEVMHLALGHHTRRGERDVAQWNEAADYVINPIVVDAGLILPEAIPIRNEFRDKSAEQVYGILAKEKQEQESQNKQQDQQQGPGSGAQGPNGNQQGQGQGQPDQSDQNGSMTGEVRDYPGDTDDGASATQAEMDKQGQEWQIIATQAATQATKCGSMPGGAMEEIRILNQPKVDWRSALMRFVDQLDNVDWSFSKPNHRYADEDFIMPSLHSYKLPEIVVAIDTSGSVSSAELVQFASEIEEILNVHDTTLKVVYCDRQVRDTVTFSREDMPIKLDVKGRGGTAFSPLFEHVNKFDDPPTCVVYLTDLDCNDFGPEPDYPVLWVQTLGRINRETPFGEVINMH